MYLWQMALGILVVVSLIGVVLRRVSEGAVIGISPNWPIDGKHNLMTLWHEHWPLALCISLEGVISNVSLLALIISVPVFFILGK